MTKSESNRARFGPYEVDLHTHELWKYGTRLKLVGQPFEILAMLLQKRGELVTREEMRDQLWPSDTFVDFNHGLNATVNKLRDALSDSADTPRYIETLPRRGYRFIAEIEWVEAKVAASPTAAAAMTEADLGRDTQAPAQERPRARSRWRRRAISAAAAIMVAAAGYSVWFYRVNSVPSAQTNVLRTRPLLAVADTGSLAFSPDGNWVAFFHRGAEGTGIFVSRVGSDQLLQLTNNEDSCPVWSPDGKSIAFTRMTDRDGQIYVIAADGGKEQKREAEKAGAARLAQMPELGREQKLETGGVIPGRCEIDWSPDGKYIAFTGPTGLYLVSPENSQLRRLTQSPTPGEDWGPQFSLEGRQVMFVRDREVGQPEELWVTPVDGGEATKLFSERGRLASPPQWSADGRSVIYSSNRTGHPSLFRVALDAPDSAVMISEAGAPAWDPAVSRRGNRLAYERLLRSLSIWQMGLEDSADKGPSLLVSSTSDTDQGPGPQFSPDGTKLAYMSDRNGTMEIWIANSDGSNGFQLTAVGGAGTPRWSPDGQAVVFDVGSNAGEKIVTMNLHGGAPQVLAEGVCASWSRDGKWIYFASGRTGGWQVWKVPATGGVPVQVTRQGGHAAKESLDGKYLYYAKNASAEPEVWRMPLEGGDEEAVPLVRPGTWASWQPVEGGIVFVGPSLGHQAVLSFYDVAKNRTTNIKVLERTPFWLGATLDGKKVAFDQPGREQTQAILVENFR